MTYKKLGELLVDKGVITNLQLSVALAAQHTSNRRLGEILIDKGFVTEKAIASCLAEQFGYPLVDLSEVKPQPNAVSMLKADQALDLQVLPISVTESEFECVIFDPVDIVTTDEISNIVKKRLKLSLGYGESLTSRIREVYGLDDDEEVSAPIADLPTRFGGLRSRRPIGNVSLYDAIDHELDRKVTMACLPTGTKEERAWRKRVQSASRVPHPSVVSIHDWFEHDGYSWCVLERLEGETLSHVLRTRGARSLTQAAETVAKICDGIEALHTKGGYIGIVCPENVFVRINGPLLLPFATPSAEYGSPELEDGHLPTVSSDIYAVGTLLWEALHGENPHIAAAMKSGARHAWAEPQPHIGNLPSQMVEILTKSVSRQPQTRYLSVLLMANALRAFNWNVVGMANSQQSKSEGDRDQLLSVLEGGQQGLRKQGFWQRIFGKAA